MVNNIVYQFPGSNVGVEISLKKMEHQKKGALRQKIEASLYILYWGFKKIPFKLYTYIVAKILQNSAKESTGELFLMALKIDAKFEGKLTCGF